MINDSVNILNVYKHIIPIHGTRVTSSITFPKGFAVRPSSVDLRKYLFLLSNNIPKVLGVPNREFRLAKGKRQASKPRFTRGKTF